MLRKSILYLEKLFFIKMQIIFYFFLLLITNSFQRECEKSTPIKKQDNECYLVYCTNEEFEQEQCIISNPIIKTQWLTNIIRTGIYNYRFVNFAITSKNELILQTTPYPSTSDNYFFGLNSNGRPYFTISGEEVLVISLSYESSSHKTRYHGEFINIIVEDNNNNREYLMSVGKDENNVEIFNFENDEIFIYSTKVMTKFYIYSKKFALLHFIDNNNKNSYILAFIGKSIDEDKNYYVLQKYEFYHNTTIDKIDYKKTEYIKIENLDNYNLKYIVSCFKTVKRLIVCFYYNSNLYYTATLYDSNLNELNSFDLAQPSQEQNLFFKCIHLKSEIGIFYYFLGVNEPSGKPKIDIIEFIKETDQINYTREYIFQSLTTKIENIKDSINYNSILKINENKFGIIQVNENKEEIYIIIYNIFNNNKEIIGRYYKIDIFKLYNYKVYYDIDSIVFNSFLITAFSVCPSASTNGDCTYFYSSVIMFSYPDTKDYEINVLDSIKSNSIFPLEEIIENKTTIDNNIFGLIKKGIQIQLYPKDENNNDIINLYSINNEKIINQKDIIDKNDKIDFYFPLPKVSANQYKIEYACVVTEPNYDTYNSYCDLIDSDHANINIEKNHIHKYEYIGKTGYLLLDVDITLQNDCNDINCLFCLETNKSDCLIYKPPENKEEENSNNENLDEKQLANIYNKLKEIIDEKSYNGGNVVLNMKDVLLQLSSVEFQEDSINDENTTNVFLGECKEILKEKYNLQDNEVLLMLKLDLFKQNSSIPLVEYEVYNYNKSEKLNLDYCNDVKINIYVPLQLDNQTIFLYNDLNSSGYNLFDSNDSFYTDICSLYTTINGTDITLSDRKKEYYNESLSLCQGEGCSYDYYNSTIKKVKCDCPISQTAIKKDNTTNQDATDFITTIVEIYNNKEKLKQIFSLSIKNMNFKVMKCFSLVFRLEYFMKNIGSILLSILIIFYLLFMCLYFVLGNKIIKELIIEAASNSKSNKRKSFLKKKSIVKFKESNNNELKDCDKSNDKKEIKIFKKKSISNIIINNQILIDTKDDKKENIENKSEIKLKDEIKKSNSNRGINIFKKGLKKLLASKIKSNKFGCPPPKIIKKKSLRGKRKALNKTKTVKIEDSTNMNNNNLDKKSNDIIIKDKDKSNASKLIKIDLKEGEKSLYSNNSEIMLNKKNSINKRKSSFINRDKDDKETNIDKDNKDEKEKEKENKLQTINNNIIKSKLPKIEDLNDEEINHLDYGVAIILDKRTFMQYYWSLLKKKQLILFTFYPSNDYNIRIIKMSFFIVSFSLYMTINGFFFSDSTMHKVYEDNGKFNIIYQIPQILYSTLVSMTINKLLKYLSLSEKSILDLKNEKNMKIATGKSQEIEKCLKIKLFVYFILGFLLMLFFWYFISTFCAVYSNTQTILIKNSLISFLISMIYPFGYALLPGLLRIPSLRAKNQDQEFIYRMSGIIALI